MRTSVSRYGIFLAAINKDSANTLDNNGNTLTRVVGTDTTSYAWDFENRMTSVTLPGFGGTVSFKYDPFGRRIYKSSSSGTSIYTYTRSGGIALPTQDDENWLSPDSPSS